LAAIPLPDIATRAMAVSNTLRSFSIKLAPSPEIETIRKQLPGMSRNIEQQLDATRRIILADASLELLQSVLEVSLTPLQFPDAVRAAGMTFLFPQREVRLLNDTQSK